MQKVEWKPARVFNPWLSERMKVGLNRRIAGRGEPVPSRGDAALVFYTNYTDSFYLVVCRITSVQSLPTGAWIAQFEETRVSEGQDKELARARKKWKDRQQSWWNRVKRAMGIVSDFGWEPVE